MAFAQEFVKVARSQLGNHEQPDGTNRGPQINKYFSAAWGGGGYPWCVCFVQWCLVQIKAGPIANRSASVYYVLNYAKKQGWRVSSKPRVGDLVIFVRGAGHIGMVQKVSEDGRTIHTVEGNASNAVRERTYTVPASDIVFVSVPDVWTKTVKKKFRVPWFQVVTSEGNNAKVLFGGPWGNVSARLPEVLKRRHKVKLQRTVREITKEVPQ